MTRHIRLAEKKVLDVASLVRFVSCGPLWRENTTSDRLEPSEILRRLRSCGRSGDRLCGVECDHCAAARCSSCRNVDSHTVGKRCPVPLLFLRVASRSSASLQFSKTLSLPLGGRDGFGAKKDCTLHRRRDGASDQAVKPVIVGSLGPHLPFVHGSASAFRLHAVLGRDMFCKQPMLFRLGTPDRKASPVPHRYR